MIKSAANLKFYLRKFRRNEKLIQSAWFHGISKNWWLPSNWKSSNFTKYLEFYLFSGRAFSNFPGKKVNKPRNQVETSRAVFFTKKITGKNKSKSQVGYALKIDFTIRHTRHTIRNFIWLNNNHCTHEIQHGKSAFQATTGSTASQNCAEYWRQVSMSNLLGLAQASCQTKMWAQIL